MPAVDLLVEWQRAESACVAAYRLIYAKVQRGVYVDPVELEKLATLSREATSSYHLYLQQLSGQDLPKPSCRIAAEAERGLLPEPLPRPAKG